MILDREVQVSNNQAVTSTAVSTDTIDLSVTNRDVGEGTNLEMLFRIGTAFATGNSATLQIQIITSAAADLSSHTVLSQSDVFAAAALTANTIVWRPDIPAGIAQRFLGVRYVVGTGSFSAGTITAAVVLDRANYRAPASGLNVSGF